MAMKIWLRVFFPAVVEATLTLNDCTIPGGDVAMEALCAVRLFVPVLLIEGGLSMHRAQWRRRAIN